MDFAHGTMVTLRSVTETDDGLGNTTRTPSDVEWGPCAIAPRYARESSAPDQPALIVGKTIYGPTPPVSLEAADELVIDGEAWQVDGEAGTWTNPFTGWAPGIEVPVKRA